MIVDAIILAGGEGRRLGGVDKAALTIGGATLLDIALATAAACREVVVVGPVRETHRAVTWTREDPPGGGPAAGVAAGLDALPGDAPVVLVLACDMPSAARAVPAVIAGARRGGGSPSGARSDGSWAVDDAGRPQPLLAAYRREALAEALERIGDPQGASMRALTAGLRMVEVPAGTAARDADTWDDVRVLREESK